MASSPIEKRKRTRLPKAGDVLRIVSFTEEDVLAHYVRVSERHGPLVAFYRGLRTEGQVTSLDGYEKILGPIGCGINPPVRSGAWVKVGHVPLSEDYRLPRFIAPAGGIPPNQPSNWYVIDAETGTEWFLGGDVPQELRSLHLSGGWSGEVIEESIRDGEDNFSYESWMRNFR